SAYFVPLVTICCLFSCSRDHPDLHSFPTRRSSDLQMESAFDAFSRHEERLRALSLRPSAYVRRQIRFTPYPTEDVGWVIAQAGPEACLFSSDYPHVEGCRRPAERLDAALGVRDRDTP